MSRKEKITGFEECKCLFDQLLLCLLDRHASAAGMKVDYGGGHVVRQLDFDGQTVEVEAFDRGNGRAVWVNKWLVGRLHSP
jgi:uncharacterized protein (DUF39 family)